jgi:hypothetical protein
MPHWPLIACMHRAMQAAKLMCCGTHRSALAHPATVQHPSRLCKLQQPVSVAPQRRRHVSLTTLSSAGLPSCRQRCGIWPGPEAGSASAAAAGAAGTGVSPHHPDRGGRPPAATAALTVCGCTVEASSPLPTCLAQPHACGLQQTPPSPCPLPALQLRAVGKATLRAGRAHARSALRHANAARGRCVQPTRCAPPVQLLQLLHLLQLLQLQLSVQLLLHAAHWMTPCLVSLQGHQAGGSGH